MLRKYRDLINLWSEQPEIFYSNLEKLDKIETENTIVINDEKPQDNISIEIQQDVEKVKDDPMEI